MNSSCETVEDARILVASDVTSDAELVRAMLCDEFRNVIAVTVSTQVVNDFDLYQPKVLILVFDTLVKTLAYQGELFRVSKLAADLSHRTVILCSNDEMAEAYALCRQQRFNDYVLFWPLVHDALRLPMAVFNALRDMQHGQGAVTVAQAITRKAICVDVDIHAAIDSFAKKIMGAEMADVLVIRDCARLQHEFDQLIKQRVQPCLQSLHHEVQPLMQWVAGMQAQRAARLATDVATLERVDHLQRLVLVVDDSEFERKLIGKLMEETFYELAFAGSGAEALGLVRKTQPDLILMDLDMPVLNGLDVLRKLKAIPQFAGIPVMMVTGQSGKGIVVDCMKAGAVDFIVKPLEREAFLNKLERLLT